MPTTRAAIPERRLSRRALLRWSGRASVGALGLALVGCGDDDDGPAPAVNGQTAEPGAPVATTVTTTLRDFEIVLDRAEVPAGAVTFAATNDGPSTHELVIVRSDLTPDALPMTEDGTQVDEGGEGVAIVDEIEGFAAGRTETATFTLRAGRYVLICNIPGHYALGMRIAFTVR